MKLFETWQPADLRKEILTIERALLSTVAGASTADAGSFTQKQRADMEAMLKQLKARLYEKTGEGSPPSGGIRVIQVLTR